MAQSTFYFNAKSTSNWTSSANMVDGVNTNYATTSSDGTTETLTGNTNANSGSVNISAVELRIYAVGDGDDQVVLTPVFGGSSNGDTHIITPGTSAAYSAWQNITSDTNAPGTWTWTDIDNLDCLVNYTKTGKADTMSVGIVELRVTYDSPPTVALNTPADTATGISTTPTLEFTGTDAQGDDVRYNVQLGTSSAFTDAVDSYPESNQDAATAVSTVIDLGQSFYSGSGGILDRVVVYLDRGSGVTGSSSVKIYAHSGTFGTSSVPTGSALASSDSINISTDVSTSFSLVTASFSGANKITLAPDTHYVLSYETDTLSGGSHRVGRDGSSPTHGGNFASAISGSWLASPSSDMIFYVYLDLVLDKVSGTDAGFANTVTPADTDPFNSGEKADYDVQVADTLDSGTTYYWRVRGIDPSGSNTYGAWATTRSFTTSGGTTTSTSTTTSQSTSTSSTSTSTTQSTSTSSTSTSTSTTESFTTSTSSTSTSTSTTQSTSTSTSTSSTSTSTTQSITTSTSTTTTQSTSTSSTSTSTTSTSTSTTTVPWYNGDCSWPYRTKVTVQSSQVGSTLTDFPVYVDLNDLPAGFHTNVNQTDARDIRVTTSDGSTEVPREVVFYDSSTDTGELHFKGTLSSTVDTDFYIYYGNASATEPATTATYGSENVWTSSYQAVYHLGEAVNTTTDGYIDSTSNSYDGTGTSMALTEQPGKLSSDSQDFDGSADYIQAGDVMDLGTNDLTLSHWIKTAQTPSTYAFSISKSIAAASDYRYAAGIYGSTAKARLFMKGNGGTDVDFSGTVTVNNDAWHLIHYVFDRSGNATIYVDGNSDGSASISAWDGQDFQSTNPFRIGSYTASDNTSISLPYDGLIDEVRVAFIVRSADWISAEHTNQNTTTTFYNVGLQEECTATTTSTSTTTSQSTSTSSTSTSTTLSTSTSSTSTSTTQSTSTSTSTSSTSTSTTQSTSTSTSTSSTSTSTTQSTSTSTSTSSTSTSTTQSTSTSTSTSSTSTSTTLSTSTSTSTSSTSTSTSTSTTQSTSTSSTSTSTSTTDSTTTSTSSTSTSTTQSTSTSTSTSSTSTSTTQSTSTSTSTSSTSTSTTQSTSTSTSTSSTSTSTTQSTSTSTSTSSTSTSTSTTTSQSTSTSSTSTSTTQSFTTSTSSTSTSISTSSTSTSTTTSQSTSTSSTSTSTTQSTSTSTSTSSTSTSTTQSTSTSTSTSSTSTSTTQSTSTSTSTSSTSTSTTQSTSTSTSTSSTSTSTTQSTSTSTSSTSTSTSTTDSTTTSTSSTSTSTTQSTSTSTSTSSTSTSTSTTESFTTSTSSTSTSTTQSTSTSTSTSSTSTSTTQSTSTSTSTSSTSTSTTQSTSTSTSTSSTSTSTTQSTSTSTSTSSTSTSTTQSTSTSTSTSSTSTSTTQSTSTSSTSSSTSTSTTVSTSSSTSSTSSSTSSTSTSFSTSTTLPPDPRTTGRVKQPGRNRGPHIETKRAVVYIANRGDRPAVKVRPEVTR